MDKAIRAHLTRIEQAILQAAPPRLWEAGVNFGCRHREATSKRPARYRVTATWSRPAGGRPRPASVTVSCENHDVEALLRSLPAFLEELVPMTREA